MTNRSARRFDWMGLSWLDFKVGFRMLARFPGLTLVGTAAIAEAIALGTVYFEAVGKWQNATVTKAMDRSRGRGRTT